MVAVLFWCWMARMGNKAYDGDLGVRHRIKHDRNRLLA